MNKPKRLLKGIKPFEISYTESSQGGACSGFNEPFLLKSNEEVEKSLTDHQKELMDKYGVDYSEISKSKESASDESNNGSQHKADNQKQNEKETDDNMSDELIKALQEETRELKKALEVEKAEKSLAGFDLEADLKLELATAIVDSGSEAIVKALTAMSEAKDAAVEKAVEVAKAEIANEDNPLAESLSKEAGEAGEEHEEVVLTKAQKLKKLTEKGAK